MQVIPILLLFFACPLRSVDFKSESFQRKRLDEGRAMYLVCEEIAKIYEREKILQEWLGQ